MEREYHSTNRDKSDSEHDHLKYCLPRETLFLSSIHNINILLAYFGQLFIPIE